MKKLLFSLVILLWASGAYAQQTILNYTTLNGAVTATATSLVLTSASAVATATVPAPAVGQMLYVNREFMQITAVASTRLTVIRGQGGTAAGSHPTLSTVFTGPANAFRTQDPVLRACTTASMGVRPWINVLSGNIWTCQSSLWQATNIVLITYNSLTPF